MGWPMRLQASRTIASPTPPAATIAITPPNCFLSSISRSESLPSFVAQVPIHVYQSAKRNADSDCRCALGSVVLVIPATDPFRGMACLIRSRP